MSDEKVVPGEEVITSGGDRIFPKGLPVGKVVSVEPGKDLFLNIRVVPSARLDQLEEVLVVTKITEKMPDAKDLGPIRASDILAERLPTVPNKAGRRCCRQRQAGRRTRRCSSAETRPQGLPRIASATRNGCRNQATRPATTTATGAKPGGTAATPLQHRRNDCVRSHGAANAGEYAATSTKPATRPERNAADASPTRRQRTQHRRNEYAAPANDDSSTPAPKKAQPAPEQPPSANPTSPQRRRRQEQPQP